MADFYKYLPELSGNELTIVKDLTKDYTDDQMMNFANVYRSRRRDPQIILLTGILGFLGIAGVQRFLVGQIGMGILYFFTAGLCFIGTIIDLVNYQNLAYEYNQKIAQEVHLLIKG